jgi:two-component system NarL family sensor kinase
MDRRFTTLRTIAIGMLLWIPFLAFLAGRVFLPGDGTAIILESTPSETGLVVETRRDQPAGLRSGDAVVAMDGRSTDDWLVQGLKNLLKPTPVRSGSVLYTILRGGRVESLAQPLERYPFSSALREHWSELVFLFYMQAVSLLVFIRRPRLPAAQGLFLLSTAVLASGVIYFMGLQASDLRYGWMVVLWLWASVALYGFVAGGLLHFSLVFPRPRPILERQPWIRIPIYLGAWLPFAVLVLAGWQHAAGASARLALSVQSTSVITATYFPLAILSIIFGYRRSPSEVVRRQLRWIVWAGTVANLPWVLLTVIPSLIGWSPLLSPGLIGILWCTIPTALAISILRERLFDIDLIIHRTLVYSLLTGLLALVYFASVVLLQTLLEVAAGQRQSAFVIVLSTLATAALFNPLRRRVQDFIDRRFYRRKYDAQKILAAFSASLRDEVEIEALSERLIAVAIETMQPAHASLWLKGKSRQELQGRTEQ